MAAHGEEGATRRSDKEDVVGPGMKNLDEWTY